MGMTTVLAEALGYLNAAPDFLGEEVVKQAIKHYAPKAFKALDETIARAWAYMREGRAPEAEKLIAESGLAEAIVASAQGLRRRTLVLTFPTLDNEFEGRLATIENIATHFFEVSRRWNADLMLRGTFAGPEGVTLFQTQDHAGGKFQYHAVELSFATSTKDHLMWVDWPQGDERSDSAKCEAIVAHYRDLLVASRKRSRSYFSLEGMEKMFRPVMFVDGGAMQLADGDQRSIAMVATNPYYNHDSRAFVPMSVDRWPEGVRTMWSSLTDMTGLLKLDPAERALVEDPSGLLGPAPAE